MDNYVTHSLRGDGFDASEDGTGRGTPIIPVIAPTLTKNYGKQVDSSDTNAGPMVIPVTFNNTGHGFWSEGEVAQTIRSGDGTGGGGARESTVIAFANTAGNTNLGIDEENGTAPPITTRHGDPGIVAYQCHGSNVGEMGTLRATDNVTAGIPFLPMAFDTTQITSAANRSNPQPGDPCHPLASLAHAPAVVFNFKGDAGDAGDQAPTMRSLSHDKSHANSGSSLAIATRYAVRRLMPVECERLQAFKDGYTDIPYRGKPAADGNRYRALGNSIITICLRQIGERIEEVEEMLRDIEGAA